MRKPLYISQSEAEDPDLIGSGDFYIELLDPDPDPCMRLDPDILKNRWLHTFKESINH